MDSVQKEDSYTFATTEEELTPRVQKIAESMRSAFDAYRQSKIKEQKVFDKLLANNSVFEKLLANKITE